jgi:hypothetical protein
MSKKYPSMTDLLAHANADFVRLNPHLQPAAARGAFRPPRGKPPRARRESTRLDSCNKTEARFYREVLARADKTLVILPQPPRFFELTGGGTFTPDFLVLAEVGPVHVVEVKGGYRGPGWEQGYERYKRAALEWNGCGFRFLLATWNAKSQGWTMEPWDAKDPPDWWGREAP